ncbi:hypothetical protein, partial [Streptomyces sp. NPDC088135]|uniref:hypothetical protein n=1 Tax=Streptomyces sp. NPDC088135 TaxID=3160993 RepID=UPI0034200AFD
MDTVRSHPGNTAVFFLQGLSQNIAALLRFSRLRSGRPGVPATPDPTRPAGRAGHGQVTGASPARIIFKELLPNLWTPILIQA